MTEVVCMCHVHMCCTNRLMMMTEPVKEIVFMNQYVRWFFQARTVHARPLQVMAHVGCGALSACGSLTQACTIKSANTTLYPIVILMH